MRILLVVQHMSLHISLTTTAQLFVATVLGGSAIWFQCDWVPAVPALGHWPMCAHGWVHNSAAAAASMLRLRHYQQLLRLVVVVVDATSVWTKSAM